VANSATGKWVSKVGASGGGKAYKKTRPSNYYALLVIIVVLGLASTALARYDYQHPSTATAASGPAPHIGTTWFGALGLDICGERLNNLTADPSYVGGFKVEPNNVILLDPVSAADAGTNATIAQFANEFPGMVASTSELAIPTSTGVANPATTYRNGQLCPATSKYPKQVGQVVYAYWRSFGQVKPQTTTNPASIKFSQYLRITMAFVPKGVTPLAPSSASVNAMVVDNTEAATTTTTSNVTTTTAAATTTTTKTTSTTSKG